MEHYLALLIPAAAGLITAWVTIGLRSDYFFVSNAKRRRISAELEFLQQFPEDSSDRLALEANLSLGVSRYLEEAVWPRSATLLLYRNVNYISAAARGLLAVIVSLLILRTQTQDSSLRTICLVLAIVMSFSWFIALLSFMSMGRQLADLSATDRQECRTAALPTTTFSQKVLSGDFAMLEIFDRGSKSKQSRRSAESAEG